MISIYYNKKGDCMAEIILSNIHKKYDNADSYSVTDFNVSIKDKEFIVFVGPSGCGKSTTLRMIAGLEDITEGDLIIDGERMNDVPPKDRGIAMVFQNYALYPHMTVYDNMAFGLKLRKYDRKDINRRVKEAAEILGLTDLLERKPAALSGGQRQRVALGRAIVRDTKIFLMDEPLSNLDAKLRVQMRSEISKLHQRLGSTTIYVTHDQTEAMTMASRIVIMKDGFIQQIGSPMEVYDFPVNVFVASFIGSPAMNFSTLTYQDGYVFNHKNIRLKVSEPHQDILEQKDYNGKEIIVGIRPEDINMEQIALDLNEESQVQATITVSELLGSESILYLETDESEYVAKVDVRDYNEAGSQVTVAFNMNKAHYFDKDTEEVIIKHQERAKIHV